MTVTRILIADDHGVLRAGLRMLIEAQSDMAVVGEAADGVEVPRKAKALQPDVVLLDISMPGPRSGVVIRRVVRACPKAQVLVLTMHDDAAYLQAALAAGAAGYLVKKAADSELMAAIRAVSAGRTFVDVSQRFRRTLRATSAMGVGQHQRPRSLSRQERAVLRFLAQGHSNQQIADKIRLSVKTVETYRARLSEKLGLRGRPALYRFAVESGLLGPGSTRRSINR